jgi:ATP-dependent DNA ligase
MSIKRLPPGFIIPAQPVMSARSPSGADWVHEIKNDGYRMIVRRDGPWVRLYSRNAYDWTVRLAPIAAAAERITAKSFTVNGEAVVLGPDGVSRFEELSRREDARTAIIGIEVGARPAVGEGFPFLLFRLRDGFIPPLFTVGIEIECAPL